ncbi:MAG: TonB-dependent hemoglobin/transferrin/lactoferrin family receptor [Gammaproteobacteria bacterium]|nr:TonB-dependent hemoglobin/transferrin/lactoferrin family receptor [Gammaproteobacteria bacterium]
MSPTLEFSFQSKSFQKKTIDTLLIVFLLPIVAQAQEPSLGRLEELTVNATRQPRTIENIAGTVSLISMEDIEKEMVDDLDDIARFQPGVSMNKNARGGNQGFTIRGIGGNRVLNVIDGVRGTDIYFGYGKDSFEMDNLQSVQIVRGPASVLYGADAMGGAVIFTTKDARDYVGGDDGSYFSVRSMASDADDQYKTGATAAFQSGDVGLIAQFTQRNWNEHKVNGPGKVNPQDGQSDGILLKGFWDVSDNQTLSISLESVEQETDFILESDLGRSVSSSLGYDQTERDRIGLEYTLERDSSLFDDLQILFNVQDTDANQRTIQSRTSFSFVNPRNPRSFGGAAAVRDTMFEFDQETTALNLNLRKSLSSGLLTHNFAYGFNFDETDTERPRDRFDKNVATNTITRDISAFPMAPAEVFPNKSFPDTTTKRWGIYLQDEIQISDSALTIIPGVRYDRYDMEADADALLDGTNLVAGFGYPVKDFDEGEVSLSLGALYDINDTYSFFGQYAEGYRAPNFNEANQAFVNLGFAYAVLPNPEIDAESSDSIELGIRADYESAFLSLSVFSNNYEDFISSNFIGAEGDLSLYQNQNIQDVEVQGAELLSYFYLNNEWRVRASVAYARGDNETDDVPIDTVDPLTLVAGLRYDNAIGNWGGELLVTAVGKKDRVSSDSVVQPNNYTVVDLIGDWELGDSLSLRLGVFNLFDEEYAHWQNVQGLNAVSSADTIANAYQPGMNIRLGFNVEF